MITLKKRRDKPMVELSTGTPSIAIKLIDAATSYKIKGADFIDNRMWSCPKCGWWKLAIHQADSKCKRCGSECKIDFWDGIIRLLAQTRSGQYMFPAGLLETVERVLKKSGYEYEVIDNATEPTIYEGLKDLQWVGWELRQHQQEAVDEAINSLDSGYGAILHMPTGSGKTVTALKLIQMKKQRTLIIVHKLNLLKQWQKEIKSMLDYDAGVWGGGEKYERDITIAMIQSMGNLNINKFNFVLADEAHHCPCFLTYNALMKSNATYKCGLTATPYRIDGNTLKMIAAIGDIKKVSDIRDLIKKGVLAKPEIRILKAPITRETGFKKYADAYRAQIVNNTERNFLVAATAQKLVQDGYTVLITVEQIKHGKALEALIQGSKFVHGKTKKEEREKELEMFEQGKRKVLVSTLLNEGSDIPTLGAIIIASGGKSQAAQLQKVGRALRTTEDKKTAIIVDIVDNVKWLRDHAQGRMMLYEETFN